MSEEGKLLKNKRSDFYKRYGYSKYDKVYEFAEYLKSKYPDYKNYEAFHILVGSSVEKGWISNFDFPGEDSINKFLDSFLKEKEKS